jgi:hypothetical protein
MALAVAAAGFGSAAVAGDLRAVAGISGLAADGVVQWIEPETAFPVALFDDPFARLPDAVQDRIVVGDPGSATYTAGQVPRMVAEEVLPAYWEQPGIWSMAGRGPTAYAGGLGLWQPRDFAGIPATDRRASEWDNGSEARVAQFPAETVGGTTRPPAPAFVPVPRGLRVEMQTEPARVFGVGSSPDLGGHYVELTRVVSGSDGRLVFTVPIAGDAGYFRLFPQ